MTTRKRATNLLQKAVGDLNFGMFLRSARVSLDITQAEIAKMLKVTKSVICDIEKGRQLVSPSLAQKIAKQAGLSEKLAIKLALQDQLAKANIDLLVDVHEAA